MQENHSFEYAVVRLVPQVEREEFVNVGVILYCRQHQFLRIKFSLDENRLRALHPKIDLDEVRLHLAAFEKICAGDASAGPIAALDLASRFRWLTAKRSTVVQISDVHPGLCKEPGETLERLFGQMVLVG
jgi:hypothetical protein